MNDSLAKTESAKQLSRDTPRHPCPFYGFDTPFPGVMLDQNGNKCALKDGYKPCHMEMSRQKPAFANCSYNTSDNREKLAKVEQSVKVFPDELRPPDQSSWEGVSLKQWTEHVLDLATPRPQ